MIKMRADSINIKPIIIDSTPKASTLGTQSKHRYPYPMAHVKESIKAQSRKALYVKGC